MKCLICDGILNQGKKYCSYECYGVAQRKRIKKICQICSKEFEFPKSQLKQHRRTCSKKCHFIFQSLRKHTRGEKHHCWKGGRRITQRGYILVKSHSNPFRDKNGNVLEHRLVMEKRLGRYLKTEEIVHHANGNSTDNRIENLRIMTKGEHTKMHNEQRFREAHKLNSHWLSNVLYFLDNE